MHNENASQNIHYSRLRTQDSSIHAPKPACRLTGMAGQLVVAVAVPMPLNWGEAPASILLSRLRPLFPSKVPLFSETGLHTKNLMAELHAGAVEILPTV